MTDNANPFSSLAHWWMLAVALMAVPAAIAQEKQPASDRSPFTDKPQVPTGTARDFVRDIAADQKQIWVSPLQMSRQSAKWWLVFGAATGTLLATDRRSAHQLPNTPDQLSVSRHVSQLGAVYSLVPIAGGLYLGGALTGNQKLRATGYLGAEALVDCLIVSEVLKTATGRQRPLQGDEGGHFFHRGNGFPSGHTIESFALASVIAHRYHEKKAVALLAYGLAATIGVSRFTSREHFASDVLAGGAMGWFIGRYVSERHRERDNLPAKVGLTSEANPPVRLAERRNGSLAVWQR